MFCIVAFVGMTGSGKSTAAQCLLDRGWAYIRFGDATIERLKTAGLAINPENEKTMREGLRREYGMGAFALLSLPAIEAAIQTGHVVVDGLYSWLEYKILRERFGDRLHVVAVHAAPKTRYDRLEKRLHDPKKDPNYRMRPLTAEQAQLRDVAEIENIEKGGPIAMADHVISNESTAESLTGQVLAYADRITR
ncbi:MAG: AAA family ATPase [candidate division Zixibacteria bacterium]|nr:AAA family ATPase [candidate division Zixibacteria bacterium]